MCTDSFLYYICTYIFGFLRDKQNITLCHLIRLLASIFVSLKTVVTYCYPDYYCFTLFKHLSKFSQTTIYFIQLDPLIKFKSMNRIRRIKWIRYILRPLINSYNCIQSFAHLNQRWQILQNSTEIHIKQEEDTNHLTN